MIAHHIHDALVQVRRLKALILEKRLFRGYSGIARMAGGLMALIGAAIMASRNFPATPDAHLLGWTAVLAGALIINYGALLRWFSAKPASRRSLRDLVPAFDALPALAVGAGLSLALIMHGEYDLLFGTWMCLYGLVHMSYRNSLPFANYLVGIFYLACGMIMLVWSGVSFTNPYPMGLVFGAGELAGGFVLCRLNKETVLEQEEETEHENND
ncbi:MAG: hypothetical protein L6437_07570 [Kiritimatiellae bacterium]|nr:hypothetical protein [Verrucomicrobiota bacterium]MBU4365961.1 hypothetical protein [Verrucomicrobiota bacterium]MCG2660088.1 hypothetical protein [Kiritimatiellia bacterium]